MTEDHRISALSEHHDLPAPNRVRYRGLCSCGKRSYMHYATPEAARAALRRTHLIPPNPERNNQ